MPKENITTHEEEAAKPLFQNAELPEPHRQVLQNILNKFEPTVTTAAAGRIPKQESRRSLVTKIVATLLPLSLTLAVVILVAHRPTNVAPSQPEITTVADADEPVDQLIDDLAQSYNDEADIEAQVALTNTDEQNFLTTEDETLNTIADTYAY